MIFYDYWRSSSGWRVRIALHWKDIAFERRPVNLLKDEQHEPAFRALNPQAQVPVLIIDEDGTPRPLAQSLAILAYLEERFPSPPLLPADPWLRGRARQLAEEVNSGIQPFQNLALTERLRAAGLPDVPAWVQDCIRRGLEALEQLAHDTAGTFLVGEAPTWADLYLVPQLYGARRFSVDLAPYPTLTRVEAACAALPPFQAAHPDRQTDAVAPASKT
jgi:maleylpyruvate isomerase